MKGLLKIITVAVVALMVLPGFLRADIGEQKKSKAEYVFAEAMKHMNSGKVDAGLALLDYAVRLDPSNTGIGQYKAKAILQAALQPGSSINDKDIKEMFDLMDAHFKAHPDDFFENRVYGRICQQAGRDSMAIEIWKELLRSNPDKENLRQLLAASYAQHHRFDEAIAVYDSIEFYEGISADLVWAKAGCYHDLGDTTAAINEVRRLYRTAPQVAQYNMMMSEIFSSFEMKDSAYVYLLKTREIDPENGPVHLALANFYDRQGRSDDYEKEIKAIVHNENVSLQDMVIVMDNYVTKWYRKIAARQDSLHLDADSCKELAKQFQEAKAKEQLAMMDFDPQPAFKLFDTLLIRYPQETMFRAMYAHVLQSAGEYELSNEQYKAVIESGEAEDDKMAIQMMLNHINLEQIPQAEQIAEQVASKDHEKLVLYNVLALHFYKKDNAKMIELYNKALSICDSTETMYRSTFSQSLADAYLSDGDTATAIPYYEKAIELNPKNVMALNNYAYLLCTLEQDLDKAERYAGIAVQQEPDNGTYVDTYAWVYFMKREYSLALMYIERAISLSGKNLSWEELEHYGDILFMNGRHDEAIEQWKRALEDYKENGNKPNPLLNKKVENGTYFPPHRKKSNDEKK